MEFVFICFQFNCISSYIILMFHVPPRWLGYQLSSIGWKQNLSSKTSISVIWVAVACRLYSICRYHKYRCGHNNTEETTALKSPKRNLVKYIPKLIIHSFHQFVVGVDSVVICMRVCVPLSIGDDQNIRLNSESARASGSGGSLTFLSKQGYPANGGRDVHFL